MISMTFGKRQSGVGGTAHALNAGTAVPQSQVVAEDAGATGHPIRWLIVLLACCWGLYALFANYGLDILRDHRLAGTWQPAYELRAMDGKCERTNFVITFCTAKITSVARPDQAPIGHKFMMLFVGGGAEALVPVRSTTDRTAVSIFYSAETRLWNRTLSVIAAAGVLVLFAIIALFFLWKAANE
jgi:hypothetical protein